MIISSLAVFSAEGCCLHYHTPHYLPYLPGAVAVRVIDLVVGVCILAQPYGTLPPYGVLHRGKIVEAQKARVRGRKKMGKLKTDVIPSEDFQTHPRSVIEQSPRASPCPRGHPAIFSTRVRAEIIGERSESSIPRYRREK